MKRRFSFKYFALSVLIFLLEVWIATGLRKVYFVRAFLGDVLVVILLYTLALSFFEIKNRGRLSVGIFIFAVLIETAQYFKLADKLGFTEGSVPHIVLGNYFSWGDIVCYAVGCFLAWSFHKIIEKSFD